MERKCGAMQGMQVGVNRTGQGGRGDVGAHGEPSCEIFYPPPVSCRVYAKSKHQHIGLKYLY